MPEPLLSVIVPCYNSKFYLEKCLGSLLGQNLEAVEIICVDDGSTDETREMLAGYADKDRRIRVVCKENGGISSARNAGLRNSRTKYVTFVDHDDYVLPEVYSTTLPNMMEDEETDFVTWGYNTVILTKKGFKAVGTAQPALNFGGRHLLTDEVNMCMKNFVWNKIFKTDIINRHNISFPEGKMHEDRIFYWKYAAHTRYVYMVKSQLTHYRKNYKSVSHNKGFYTNRMTYDALRNIFEYYDKLSMLHNHINLMSYIFSEFVRVCSELSSEDIELLNKLIEEYDLPNRDDDYIAKIKRGEKPFIAKPRYSWLERVASVKNEREWKVFCLLGFKYKVRRDIIF